MKKQLSIGAMTIFCISLRMVEAAPVYTFAQATAGSTANAGGSLWNASQFREITTPTAGESETASVIRTGMSASGSGNGNVQTHLALNSQGFSGTLDQAVNLTLGPNFAFNFVAGSTTGAAFVDFTLSSPHTYSAMASGQISAPTGADNQNIGLQIQLERSNGTFAVEFFKDTSGAVSLNQGGILPVGTYSYSAALLNTFVFNATPPGAYNSSGNVSYSLTLIPVPECSAFVLAVVGMGGMFSAAIRQWRTERRSH